MSVRAKNLRLIAISSLVSAGLIFGVAGCTPGNNTGGATIAGAAAGGLLGAAAFHGEGAWLGVLGGALVGGIVGNQIGQYMDRQDVANMRSAIVSTPVGQESSWTNERQHATYTVRPIKNYHSHGRYCREYQTKVKIGGRIRNAYGRACRMSDGSWKVVK